MKTKKSAHAPLTALVLLLSVFSGGLLEAKLARAEYDENRHLLSVAGGIASPSVNTALYENAAGLIYNQRLKALPSLSSENHDLDPLGCGLGAFAGNSYVGGGAEYRNISSNSIKDGEIAFGVGADVLANDFSIGATGYLGTKDNLTGWGLDIGMLFKPYDYLHFGAAVYSLIGGLDAFGAGVAYEVNPSAVIALDGCINKSGEGKVVKPGIGVNLDMFQGTVSYGLPLDTNEPSHIRAYFTAGLGVRFTDNIHLQVYYNELSLYYAALAFRI